MKIKVDSVADTIKLASKIAKTLDGSEILLLSGDLGAGKTTFTKALAKALGINDLVTSPTFAFMKEYFGRFKLSHYDMYRVESEDELWELGIGDNLEENGICVIEWNKFTLFPNDKRIINISIAKLDDEDSRLFEIDGIKELVL